MIIYFSISKIHLSFIALCVAASSFFNNEPSCSYNNISLQGRVQIVDSFPDIKVSHVNAFPDLKVKRVDSFPDACGEWQFVDSFPDFTVQFVDSFPDFKIQYVDAFPGLP